MKKFLILPLIATVMVFISCSDDDDNGNANGGQSGPLCEESNLSADINVEGLTLDIEVTGGIPPFSYAWNHGDTTALIEVEDASIYTVTVTDSLDCTYETSVEVGDPILGSWEVASIKITLVDNEGNTFEQEWSAASCTPTPVTTLNSDGTMSTVEFEIDTDFEGNVECEVFDTLTGTYEQIQGNTYILDLEGEEPQEMQLILSNGGNTLDIVTSIDGDGEYLIRHTRQ